MQNKIRKRELSCTFFKIKQYNAFILYLPQLLMFVKFFSVARPRGACGGGDRHRRPV